VDLFLACIAAVAGLVFGSFLNVCITRIPRDESIVSPGSHCPSCGVSIAWHHNIPVLSFVLLRGRCAACKARIPYRYLIVELLTAVLFLACFAKFGLSITSLKFASFSFLLIGLIFMDGETGLLPAEFTYPGIALGLFFAWLAPGDGSGTEFLLRIVGFQPALGVRQLSLLDAAIAALFGAAFFYSIWAMYYLVRKRHGMGFGDIALIAMCGAFLGLKLTVFVLFLAPVLGAVYSIALVVANAVASSTRAPSETTPLTTHQMLRTREIPFGVFLGACSLIAVFWGETAWSLYLSWAKLG
jgi:leader peptidase (prepilin peptidase)/N-methyltransferase